MINIASILPSPKQKVVAPTQVLRQTQEIVQTGPTRVIPPYGSRKGWIPRVAADFGDGGAYPEVHVAQYPLNMGNKQSSTNSKTLPVTLDAQGRVKYEAIVNPGGNRAIQARHEDTTAKRFEEEDLRRPDPEDQARLMEKTKAALEKVVNLKIAAAQPTNPGGTQEPNTSFIRYTPSQQGGNFNSGSTQRIIRMTEMPIDPLEPPKFKHKKVPRGPPSPPVPVMHSPPRKVTAKDQQDWKIPPCISNWKNNRGYVIPLDKRLAADGRGLAEVQINDNFAKLSESLYIAERNAREEVAKRAEVERRLKLKEKEKKEEMLRNLAQQARAERTQQNIDETETPEEQAARMERDQIREERRRERERDLRMQRNKSAAARNADRDVSERIALGMAVPQGTGETLYDQRLFNQSQGIGSGFGDDEAYNVYTKPLFQGSSANQIYKPPKKDADDENYGTEEDYQKLLDTSKFRPDKDFSGVERDSSKPSGPRNAPVEFEKKEEDLFGLDEFLSAAKKGGSRPLDKIGRGHLHAATTSTGEGSKRSRINFESSKYNDDDRETRSSKRR